MRAAAVEKRYFPWQYDRFAEQLLKTVKKLHWRDCRISNSYLTAVLRERRKIGQVECELDFTVTASFVSRGEGVELILCVSEHSNSWSTRDCKNKLKVVLDLLSEPLYPIRSAEMPTVLKA
jgi:hypothetical protein